MKQPHTTTVFFILIFLNTTVFWAQKHPASVLDMRTANGGILSPQLTTTQRDALATDNDSKGLLIYNTDTNKFNFHDGTSWIVLSAGGSSTLLDADGDTKVQVEESGDEDLLRFDTAGTQRMYINSGGIELTGDNTHFKTYGTANTTSNRKWQWSHRLDDKFQMWHFYPGGNWQTYITVLPDNGRIGIKTSAPTNDLSINGNANKTGGGTWGTFSDRRIKKEIEDYTTGLDAILKIHPISYQYNDKSPFKNPVGDKPMVGIIAQEMQQILPNTISTHKTEHFDDLLEYNGSELTYTLVNAIKELYAQNQALKARVEALEK